MRNIGGMILAGCLLLPSLASCSSVTPHENFIMTMQSDIGKNLDDPTLSGWMQSARLIDHKSLLNGDIEYAYRFRGDCRYFYEVGPKTRKIVGWRFEGSERDCIINP
jgi:hypothetical protein